MPSISVQPSSSTVCEGQSYTFSITASGAAPLTYQWYKGGVSIANANNNTYTISSIQSSDATTYYCIVTNSCNSATSSTASLTVNSSPNITSQTSSIDVCSGSAAPFSITASGTAPMTYQWYNSAGSIALATSSTYTIGSTTTSDASNYYCKVTNACGTDWTTSIPLTVQSSPSITSQTPSLSKCEGQSAIFDIQVSGSSPLTYQWKKDGIAISGAVSSSLLISPVSSNDNASYICTATNSCGSVSSTASNLTVNSNVTITSQSSSQTLCEGSSPTLSVTANGTAPITYQWYNNSGLITGATNNTYSINSIDTSDAGNYYCVATNTCTSTSSNAITINVNEAPSIDNNPVSAIVCENYSTVFSVSASGTNPMTYQWYNSSGIISGATGSSYIIPQVVSSDAGTYYVKATNACGTVTSQNASLTVNTPVSITAQSSSSSVCSGASPSLSITAAGTSPINYQWYKDGSAISGATNNSLSLTSVSTSDAANYYVVATNSCNSVPSNTMTLTVNQGPSIVNQPTAQSVCEGTSTQLNVSASGTAPMTYQWYKASSPITGATNNNYIISSASSTDAASYYVKVTNSCGNVNSQNASLTVNIPANITAQSTSTAVCGGASPSLTITASGTAPLTYQWYKDGSAISGATNNAYNLTSVDTSDDATYYAIVTNSCNSDQSNPIILTVNESPSIVTQPISSIACSGSSTMLSISSNGTAPLSYQWYKGGTPITGAISNTYIIGSVTSTDAGSYYCKVSNSCATVTSNNASLVVNDPVLITSQSGDSTKCVGDAMMFSISNTGTAPITYQWYHNGNAITGGTSSAYSINAVALANAGDYYCIASNACNSTQSSVKNLVVNTVPAITQQSSDTSICSGNNLTLNVMTSGSSPMSYQWYKGSTAMGGAINNVYPMYQISTSDAATYYCVATNSCGNAQSNNMVITVNSPPSITYQSADSTRCEGESMTFKVTATGTAPLSYQWYNGQTAINGGDTSIYNIANVVPADNGNYHAVITNTCASVSSAYKYLTVHATPQVNLGNDTTFCDGGSVIIGPGYGYYAVWNTGQIASQLNITTTGTYSASVVDQYGCNGLTDTINVNVVLPYANQEICLVTVDSATSKNIIVWEKTPNMGISSFNVYKESNISGVYSLLANRPYDSLSVVLDLASNPTVSAERYAITVVDSCGNESPFSPAHRTLHMTVNKGQNNDWNLIWNAYEGFTPSSYKIYRADTSLNFVNIATVSGSSSYTYLYTDQSAPANVTLYYYVEVVHPNGGCNATKGKTSYNSSRSNRANSGNVNPTSLVPAFFGTPTSGVFPLEVHFFDQSQGTPIEWEWDFGDGSIDSVQNPVHSYTQIGVYSVSLIVKDAGSMNSVAFQNYITVLTTGIAEVDEEFVVKVFPNPYSDKTSIAYALTNQTKVVMEVYTAQGQKVAELINTEQSAGSYKVQFRAADYGFASGVYILRMHVGDQLITKKLIEVK
jgi:PKD repeat protein